MEMCNVKPSSQGFVKRNVSCTEELQLLFRPKLSFNGIFTIFLY